MAGKFFKVFIARLASCAWRGRSHSMPIHLAPPHRGGQLGLGCPFDPKSSKPTGLLLPGSRGSPTFGGMSGMGLVLAATKVFSSLELDPMGLISAAPIHVYARGSPSMVSRPDFQK
jgi:hypothetical protein